MMSDPTPVAKAQIDLFNESMAVWKSAAESMWLTRPCESDKPKDKRFKHPDWTENAVFNYVKESYLVAAKAILFDRPRRQGHGRRHCSKGRLLPRRFVDAISPSNFVATNPEVLKATLETGGQNLLRGLDNLLFRSRSWRGRLSITMTDMKAFRLGENIATTFPGRSFSRTT